MSWITNRISENSTHNGVVVAGAAVAVIWGGFALMDIIMWGALIWGVWNIVKKG
jgi:hypothetical protein